MFGLFAALGDSSLNERTSLFNRPNVGAIQAIEELCFSGPIFFKKDARFCPYFRYGVIRNGSIAMRHARSPVTKIVESRKAE